MPKFFYKHSSVIFVFLLPVLILYVLGFTTIYFFKFHVCRFRVKNKIICIGSFITGGAGKTEICKTIGKELQKIGLEICYLTKGYGRKCKNDYFLKKNSENLDATAVGDEPILLSKIADVFVAKNRKSALRSKEIEKYDVVIMDDGLFDARFDKINIVLFDSKFLDGNSHILPIGPKRICYRYFRNNIDCVIYTNFDESCKNNVEEFHKKFHTKDRLYSQIESNSMHDKSQKYIAFSGLAMNEKFFNMLKTDGFNVIKEISFKDHHMYKRQEIEEILQFASKNNAEVITTQKDLVKLDNVGKKGLEIYHIFHYIENCDIFIQKTLQFKK